MKQVKIVENEENPETLNDKWNPESSNLKY